MCPLSLALIHREAVLLSRNTPLCRRRHFCQQTALLPQLLRKWLSAKSTCQPREENAGLLQSCFNVFLGKTFCCLFIPLLDVNTFNKTLK